MPIAIDISASIFPAFPQLFGVRFCCFVAKTSATMPRITEPIADEVMPTMPSTTAATPSELSTCL